MAAAAPQLWVCRLRYVSYIYTVETRMLERQKDMRYQWMGP